MKILRSENRYGSGDKAKFDSKFNYLLFRQDWSGNESVYFDENEINIVLDKINDGSIPVHMNYSILYCDNQENLEKVVGKFGCYEVLVSDKT
jgi:molybdopterin/thiamine biosynthesis adenylyltransferase